ncbi:MAG: NAD(P)/FAD-dependent oxidoreductase [Candidatus Omnitrophica bacterium]|nr:NAD(P)/FAD-dependent oxidoreductase [Candidatus Omnitrophota bacterium]
MVRFDIAVIGAGPSGVMAAIRAAYRGMKVVIFETNPILGRKLALTGNGRCNLTNNADIDSFIGKFPKSGLFLRNAFSAFSNYDLIGFFKNHGLDVKSEDQGKVFAFDDNAFSVVAALKAALLESGAVIKYSTRIDRVVLSEKKFEIITQSGLRFFADKVVLATGGLAYPQTGSCGDGYRIARQLGHTVIKPLPALVPLKVKENWVKSLKGLSLSAVSVYIPVISKKAFFFGDIIFTDYGVSGPLIIDLSRDIVDFIQDQNTINIFIDLKPDITKSELESIFLKFYQTKGKMIIKNALSDFLPKRFADLVIDLLQIPRETLVSQISKIQRKGLIGMIKSLPLTVFGTLPFENAMVTKGGVLSREINPRNMQSKKVNGLFFAGEIIDGAACCGGYNLQKAFSTGYLAGEGASQ